jgi:transposase
MVQAKPEIVELDMKELDDILRRAEAALDTKDYETIRKVIAAYEYLVEVVGDKDTTLRRLRQMLFGAKTEKTAAVIGGSKGVEKTSPEAAAVDAPAAGAGEARATVNTETIAETLGESDPSASDEASAGPPGHGRNGADTYTGAEKIEVRHESLQPGDPCPNCEAGTLYDTRRPGVLVRLVGQAPVGATVYYLQKLRCGLCGALFTADPPTGVSAGEKYDPTVGSMIALLKYGNGMPFNRGEHLQENLGIPLPASTQWDIVEAQAERAEPVFAELVRQAAQGDVVYNDDTAVKILELMGERARQAALAENTATDPEDATEEPGPDRTGLFTSGIVATAEGHKIVLFVSGRQHAGENLKDVLVRRAAELPPPIQMCDALSRNIPKELQTILANCLAHGRRQFVDVADRFPEECQHVLEAFSVVYRNDAIAKERNLSPEQRLVLHQAESGPVMEGLRIWLGRQFDQRQVEPNSALGKAISYLLRHWEKLTLFLRVPGAPLDNNICEQALKKAIRHRRNSLFYKTRHGAHVGDVFMSLIHTCELCGANPFDYLTELDRHAGEMGANPQEWMPWNYREMLEGKEHAQTPPEESREDHRCCPEAAPGPGETHESRVD